MCFCKDTFVFYFYFTELNFFKIIFGLTISIVFSCVLGVLGRWCCSKQDVCLHFSPSLIVAKDLSDLTPSHFFRQSADIQTRAPISGLSSTLTCNSQSPLLTALYSKLLNHGWKIPMRPCRGGTLRTLWTDLDETSNPEGLKVWHGEYRERHQARDVWDRKGEKKTNELQHSSAYTTLVWTLEGEYWLSFFLYIFVLLCLFSFSSQHGIFSFYILDVVKGMCFILDNIKILKTGFREVSVAFFVEIKSWTLLVYLWTYHVQYSMYACKCFCPIVATVHTTQLTLIPWIWIHATNKQKMKLIPVNLYSKCRMRENFICDIFRDICSNMVYLINKKWDLKKSFL